MRKESKERERDERERESRNHGRQIEFSVKQINKNNETRRVKGLYCHVSKRLAAYGACVMAAGVSLKKSREFSYSCTYVY